MIRTLIEVTGENDWQYEKNLNTALDKLGFQPKPSEAQTKHDSDMWQALREAGIDVGKLTEEFQHKRVKEVFLRVEGGRGGDCA